MGAVPLEPTLAFTLAAAAGALGGVRLAGSLDALKLRRAFATFVVIVGLALLAANLRGT